MTVKNLDSKQKSIIEAVSNVVGGFIIGTVLNMYVIPPILGIEQSIMTWDIAMLFAVIFGSASIARSFTLRRLFMRVRNDFDIRKWLSGVF